MTQNRILCLLALLAYQTRSLRWHRKCDLCTRSSYYTNSAPTFCITNVSPGAWLIQPLHPREYQTDDSLSSVLSSFLPPFSHPPSRPFLPHYPLIPIYYEFQPRQYTKFRVEHQKLDQFPGRLVPGIVGGRVCEGASCDAGGIHHALLVRPGHPL